MSILRALCTTCGIIDLCYGFLTLGRKISEHIIWLGPLKIEILVVLFCLVLSLVFNMLGRISAHFPGADFHSQFATIILPIKKIYYYVILLTSVSYFRAGAYFRGGIAALDREICIVNRNLMGRGGVKYLIYKICISIVK